MRVQSCAAVGRSFSGSLGQWTRHRAAPAAPALGPGFSRVHSSSKGLLQLRQPAGCSTRAQQLRHRLRCAARKPTTARCAAVAEADGPPPGDAPEDSPIEGAPRCAPRPHFFIGIRVIHKRKALYIFWRARKARSAAAAGAAAGPGTLVTWRCAAWQATWFPSLSKACVPNTQR